MASLRLRPLFLVVVSFLLVICISPLAMAQADAGCIKSGCHEDMGTKKFVHGPVGARICTVCHVPVEGQDHSFQFFSDKAELCLACHEDNRDMMLMEHRHSPVADGNCIGCHDPHQSDYRFTLKGEAEDLCFQCHDRAAFSKTFVHGPIEAGDCNACHNPHASPYPNQLLDAPGKICFLCHAEKVDELQKRHIHPPVEDNCANCHTPHSSDNRSLLSSNPPDLCIGCHDLKLQAEVPHVPVANGNCEGCHDSHASDNPMLFVASGSDLCFSCHEELGSYVSQQTYLHGPVQQGDCSACHAPHGSTNYRLLKLYFPKEFYVPYQTSNYAACFECHNKDIALDPETKTLTDFRDGKRNLHFLHVNKDPKGRSCKSCHQAHATDQYKHIRRSVPYGSMNWELPINFTKLPDGGRCEVGCHAVKEYHR